MSVPGIVESALDGEEIAARVSLGGEDELYVTPTRSLIYRAEGLLSDESFEEYGHDAERLTISEGRRKTRFSLEYAIDGTQEFTLPAKHADEAVHPILAGMLNASGVTDPGEAVLHTYRFSELTLVITSDRVVKHIGEAVWDGEYEEYPFSELTRVSFEEGEHATQFVLEIDGRPERIKAPNDEAPRVREHLKQALFEFYDVRSMAELHEKIEPDKPTDEGRDDGSNVDFGEGVDPLEANPPSNGMDSSREQLTDDRLDGTGERGTTAAGAGGTAAADSADADRSRQPEGGEEAVDTRNGGERSEPSATEDRQPAERAADHATERQPTEQQSGDHTTERQSTERTPQGSVESDPATPVAEPDTDPEPVDPSGEDVHETLEEAGFEPAEDAQPDLEAEIDELRAAVEKQNKLLARQQQTIEQLIEELRRGRLAGIVQATQATERRILGFFVRQRIG